MCVPLPAAACPLFFPPSLPPSLPMSLLCSPQGGIQNVVNMFLFLTEQHLEPAGLPPPPPPQETPQTGCLHPSRPGQFWAGPAEYMAWWVVAGAEGLAQRTGSGGAVCRVTASYGGVMMQHTWQLWCA